MIEQAQALQEAEVETKDEAPRMLTLSDMKSANDVRSMLSSTLATQTQWAMARIQSTGYQQAVQTELALNRTDLLAFAVQALLNLVDEQQRELADVYKLVAKQAAKSAPPKKGGAK